MTRLILAFLLTSAAPSSKAVNESPIPSTTRASIDGDAVVRKVTGAVEYAYDSTGWKPLEAGKVLQPGAAIRAKGKSSALVQMEDTGSFVQVSSGTTLILSKAAPQSELSLAKVTRQPARKPVKVRAVRGEAQVYSSEGEWNRAKVNSTLQKGAILKTGENSTVDLFFADQGLVVRVTPNTVLRLEQMDFETEFEPNAVQAVVTVPKGQILTNARMKTVAQYEMKPAQILYRLSHE
ncbi:MAG: hypothetical protein SFY81_14870 [Verrucomicrobiota bacterium]|nr:hypothetical protein [Verrucomicrobiota bacterium]